MLRKNAPASAHQPVSNLDKAAPRRFYSSEPYLGKDQRRYPVHTEGFEDMPGYQIPKKRESSDNRARPIGELTYPQVRTRESTPAPKTRTQLGSPIDPIQSSASLSEPTVVTDTTVYPWRANAALMVSVPGTTQPFVATGWFISPYAVITAGHVVHPNGDQGYTGWAASIDVIPGLDGLENTPPYGSVKSVKFFCPTGWEQDADPRLDYAVVLLPQGLGSTVGFYGYATYTDGDLQSSIVNVAGYPFRAPDGSAADGRQYYSAGNVQSLDDSFVYYNLGTEGGDSGACVYRNIGDQSYALAIHTIGGDIDRGVRIIEPVYQNLQQWATMQG